eukprot:5855217-Ditylum_brightwellii.AAC.1
MLLVLGAGMWGPGSGAGTQQFALESLAKCMTSLAIISVLVGCWCCGKVEHIKIFSSMRGVQILSVLRAKYRGK